MRVSHAPHLLTRVLQVRIGIQAATRIACRYTTIKSGRRRLLVPNSAFITREFMVLDDSPTDGGAPNPWDKPKARRNKCDICQSDHARVPAYDAYDTPGDAGVPLPQDSPDMQPNIGTS